jgi:hypothetical protein
MTLPSQLLQPRISAARASCLFSSNRVAIVRTIDELDAEHHPFRCRLGGPDDILPLLLLLLRQGLRPSHCTDVLQTLVEWPRNPLPVDLVPEPITRRGTAEYIGDLHMSRFNCAAGK